MKHHFEPTRIFVGRMSRRRYPPNGILIRRKALRFFAIQILNMFR